MIHCIVLLHIIHSFIFSICLILVTTDLELILAILAARHENLPQMVQHIMHTFIHTKGQFC